MWGRMAQHFENSSKHACQLVAAFQQVIDGLGRASASCSSRNRQSHYNELALTCVCAQMNWNGAAHCYRGRVVNGTED